MLFSKNKIVNVGLFLTFLGLCLAGLFSYEQLTSFYFQYNLLNVNLVLEILFLMLIFKSIRAVSASKADLFLIFVMFTYISYSLILSVFLKDDHINDFLMIYKVFLYLMVFLSLRLEPFIRIQWLYLIFVTILFSILLKYTIGKTFYDIKRPGLLYENNFELLLVNLLFFFLYYSYPAIKKYALLFVLLIAFVTIASGSRSAALCLMMTLMFIYKGGFRKVIIITPIFIILLLYQIYSRGLNIEVIDRFNFLIHFISLYRNFSFFEFLFGSVPITALPSDVCAKFEFYKALFSDLDSLKCYSVVFHSFILRALFDHGLVGLISLFLIYHRVISKKMGSYFASYAVLLAVINGLSVSSLNSIYFNLPLLMIFLVVEKNEIKT